MSARNDTLALMGHLNRNGIAADFDDANTLRRAQIALHRWAEQECGDNSDYALYSIERDEATNLPYRCIYPHNGQMRRYRIADKEAGALRRVAAICKRLEAHARHCVQHITRVCWYRVAALALWGAALVSCVNVLPL